MLPCVHAQDSLLPAASSTDALPAPSVGREVGSELLTETFSPFTAAAGVFNAGVSQITRSAPLYGRHPWKDDAAVKRFGASLGDISSQNLFSDFLLASAFHEDTRYRRRRSWPQAMAAHPLRHQPVCDYENGFRRHDVQLRECAGHRDERGTFERLLSSGEQNDVRFADQFGDRYCRLRGSPI